MGNFDVHRSSSGRETASFSASKYLRRTNKQSCDFEDLTHYFYIPVETAETVSNTPRSRDFLMNPHQSLRTRGKDARRRERQAQDAPQHLVCLATRYNQERILCSTIMVQWNRCTQATTPLPNKTIAYRTRTPGVRTRMRYHATARAQKGAPHVCSPPAGCAT